MYIMMTKESDHHTGWTSRDGYVWTPTIQGDMFKVSTWMEKQRERGATDLDDLRKTG